MIGYSRWFTAKTQSLVVLLVGLAGQQAAAEAVWGEYDSSGKITIRMEVTPADEPSPAFKYRLSLRPHELVPGNSVAHYMRAFPEGGLKKTWSRARERYGEEIDNWYGTDIPISQLPLDRMREAAGPFRGLVDNHVRPGAKCREADWGVSYVDIRGPEVITFLLPEIQSMRSLARAMSLRTRLAIAEQRYDDTIDLLRMNYRLGRDVGKQPILVSGLVGIAICGITNSSAIDLIAAPDSPNLYWALSALPRPQVPMRDAMRLELAIGPRMFEILDSPETKQHTATEWNALWMRDARLLDEDDLWMDDPDRVEKPHERFLPAMFGLVGYSHAKRRLVDWDYAEEEVEAMAVGQVLAIYSARVYEIVANESEKALYVPPCEGKRLDDTAWQVENTMRAFSNHPDREILPIASLLLPASASARSAVNRLERDIDALRVIEALRMHAAQNNNEWPAKLADVTCVPVPENPATGEPFEYSLEGDTAVLLLPLNDGFRVERRYELTIVK